MFYEVYWSGYETAHNKFCKSFEKAIEIAKKYTNDEDFMDEYDLNQGCSISKYEFDEQSEEYIVIEMYVYNARTDEITEEAIE